jgi:indole-3-glycerol phosphate synthase
VNRAFQELVAQQRRRWLEDAERADIVATVADRLASAAPPRSACEALTEDSLALIVEPKRATFARGTINPALDVSAIARECERAGAVAMSIVTEPAMSEGSLADLAAARIACSLPLLARDFVVHPLQVRELRSIGADAIFLPVGTFTDFDGDGDLSLERIVEEAHRLGMDVALSVQSAADLELALDHDLDLINIDNRGGDGSIDVERTLDLLADVPVGTPVMSESIAHAAEVARLHRAGVDALLLDEGHMEHGLAAALAVYADLALD